MTYNEQAELMLDILEYSNPGVLKEVKFLKDDNNLVKSSHYEFAMTTSLEINDANKLRILRPVFSNIDLLWSTYYEFTLTKLNKVENIKHLSELTKLCINVELLNSKYYKFAITKACSIKTLPMLKVFINLELNSVLLNSKCYKYILNRLEILNNVDICNKMLKILNLLEQGVFEEEKDKVLKTIIDILYTNNKVNIIYLLMMFYFKLQKRMNEFNKLINARQKINILIKKQ